MHTYWDIRQLANYLNIKPATLYAWAAQGKIPSLKLHGLLRFRQDEIDEWLESCERTSPPNKRKSHPTRNAGVEVATLIARAKAEVYTSQPRGNQTEIKPHRKGGVRWGS